MADKRLIGILGFFALFGVIMFSIFVHEAFHVFHANSSTGSSAGKSICVDMNLKAKPSDNLQEGNFVAHAVLDVDKWKNVESFDSWRELSEKWAGLIQSFLQLFLAAGMGAIMVLLLKK